MSQQQSIDRHNRDSDEQQSPQRRRGVGWVPDFPHGLDWRDDDILGFEVNI